MSTQLLASPVFKGFANNGQPLSGGLLYTFAAGTVTPQAAYTDATGATPLPNPVVLNSRGEASIWLTPAQGYKLQLTDSSGNVIWTVDQVYGIAALTAANINAILGTITIPVSQTSTGAWYAPTARIDRLTDRVFVGDAVNQLGTTGTSGSDWLSTWYASKGEALGGPMQQTVFSSLTTSAIESLGSAYAAVLGCQTARGAIAAEGLCILAINNSTTQAASVWGLYIEAHLDSTNGVSPSALNASIGIEIDTCNRGGQIGINPYTENVGATYALQLASGAQQGISCAATFSTNVMTITNTYIGSDNGGIKVGYVVAGVGITPGTTITSFGTGNGGTGAAGNSANGTYNLSTSPGTISPARTVSVAASFDNTAAINIQANPSPFSAGINFGNAAISKSDGINGVALAPAIQFAQNQGMIWYTWNNASPIYSGAIYNVATAQSGSTVLQLGQSATNFLETASSAINFQVAIVASALNYPFVQASAVTGNAAQIGCVATGTNKNLALVTPANGLIQFATASHFSVNGAVGTSVTGVGPSGANTTVQEWLTIKNASGTTRYIPCF